MSNWLKGLFGKKCNCEHGCCKEKKTVTEAPKAELTEKVVTETITTTSTPTEEAKA